jgi:paraquat-inducible protein B
MSKKANPALIGLFTLAALILTAAALVVLGAGKYFQKTHNVLLYFEKSVNGLQVGSDVRFGGVRIGRVASIRVIIDTAGNRKIIPVVVELAENQLGVVTRAGGGVLDLSSEKGVREAVREGLRAGMKQQSLVTGQLYIEFDIVKDLPGFVYKTSETPLHPVIPTIPTEMDELIAGISDGLKKINALDLEGVMEEIRKLLASANERIEEIDLKQINENLVGITGDIRTITGDEKLKAAIDNLDGTLAELRELTAKANQGISPMLEDFTKMAENLNKSLVRIETLATELRNTGDPRSPMMLNLQNVIQETERASRSLQELTGDLKRNPNSLLRGRDKKE